VNGLLNVTASNFEFNVRFFVLIVPSPASASSPPAFIVTELLPFRVPPTVTFCAAAAFDVSVMSLAPVTPAVCKLAAVAVTSSVVPAVLAFNVTSDALESDTTAEVPALNVKLVASVSVITTFVPAVALKLVVDNSPTDVTCLAAFNTIDELAVNGLLNVTASNFEFNVRFFVLIVPSPASASSPPAFIVTELLPFRVPPTVTFCAAAAFDVSVMSLAPVTPAVCKLAAVAVTSSVVPAVLAFNVTSDVLESDTTAEDPAERVKLVASVSVIATLVPAVALKLVVDNSPTDVTCLAALNTIDELAVNGLLNVTASNFEFNVRFFVLIVPNPASASNPPAFIVTELLPFRVPPTVTF
jgi:hypothetical protein